MSKHTPGPWTNEKTIYLSRGFKIGLNLGSVPAADEGEFPEYEANACLVAAAPDLLDALQSAQKALAAIVAPDAIAFSSVQHAWAHAVEAEAKARTAIAKAKGETA